ncbi:hypothetical protein CHLRE_04g230046v5 [Chlamydomonas reinhardtii]|uniref:Uncharacterized protein n=1 Tax=Chlamydomonas reinhardtii TaxID=3055 RepID=A0A2K3DUY2_CHLRE|nr:uncharacterized protein CHLRE_04g230046v5 [Chlamydomonas reinhardtii]PNW84335.1 hypothetical protein CHLRE_04g230046v5 [Chlamydomonas reinhardtii]
MQTELQLSAKVNICDRPRAWARQDRPGGHALLAPAVAAPCGPLQVCSGGSFGSNTGSSGTGSGAGGGGRGGRRFLPRGLPDDDRGGGSGAGGGPSSRQVAWEVLLGLLAWAGGGLAVGSVAGWLAVVWAAVLYVLEPPSTAVILSSSGAFGCGPWSPVWRSVGALFMTLAEQRGWDKIVIEKGVRWLRNRRRRGGGDGDGGGGGGGAGGGDGSDLRGETRPAVAAADDRLTAAAPAAGAAAPASMPPPAAAAAGQAAAAAAAAPPPSPPPAAMHNAQGVPTSSAAAAAAAAAAAEEEEERLCRMYRTCMRLGMVLATTAVLVAGAVGAGELTDVCFEAAVARPNRLARQAKWEARRAERAARHRGAGA